MSQGQFDPNNNDDPNNNPGPPYTGAADGAPGNTTIHRQAPVTYYNGTGNLTASRAWKFGSVAAEGWTIGDLVYLSLPEHAGTGFTVTVETIAGATLTAWGALAANGGAFMFNGTDFQAVIPGADQGSGGGGGPYWINGNQNGPVTNQSTEASIGVGVAPPVQVAGAMQINTTAGTLISTNGAAQLGATIGGALVNGGGPGGVAIGSGASPPTSPNQINLEAAGAVEIFSPSTCVSDNALTASHASSAFDVSSTTRGARPWPTMTNAQRNAIPSPALNLKVTMTDVVPGDYIWNGSAWIAFGWQPSEVVYREGGVAGNGVYTSMIEAVVAATIIAPFAPTIIIDGSLGSPVIPAAAGILALPAGTTIRSREAEVNFTLTIQEGAGLALTDSLYLVNVELLWQNTSAPVCTLNSGGTVLVQLDNALATADGAATKPLFSVASGTALSLEMMQSLFQGTVAAPVVSAAAGATVTSFGNWSSINANSLTGPGAIAVQMDQTSTIASPQTSASALTVSQLGATLILQALSLSAAGGAQNIPARPSTILSPAPSKFLATPSGNQASTTTYTLITSGYQPYDVVRVLFTVTQAAIANVTVLDGGSGTPTLGVLQVAKMTAATGSGWIEAQLNQAGTHWTLLGGGYL